MPDTHFTSIGMGRLFIQATATNTGLTIETDNDAMRCRLRGGNHALKDAIEKQKVVAGHETSNPVRTVSYPRAV
jgi:hypothetical protein